MIRKSFQRDLPVILLGGVAVWALSACQSGLPKEVRDLANPGLTYERVSKDPEASRGEVVLWGGVIVETRNTEQGAYLEVIQFPLDRGDRPLPGEESGGRFLIHHKEFLDPAVYTPGREITVVGEILGVKPGHIDEMEYTYPLIGERNLVLWGGPRRPGPRIQFGIGATIVR